MCTLKSADLFSDCKHVADDNALKTSKQTAQMISCVPPALTELIQRHQRAALWLKNFLPAATHSLSECVHFMAHTHTSGLCVIKSARRLKYVRSAKLCLLLTTTLFFCSFHACLHLFIKTRQQVYICVGKNRTAI
jgi:hypothetical protein